jgi:hypothetical protein
MLVKICASSVAIANLQHCSPHNPKSTQTRGSTVIPCTLWNSSQLDANDPKNGGPFIIPSTIRLWDRQPAVKPNIIRFAPKLLVQILQCVYCAFLQDTPKEAFNTVESELWRRESMPEKNSIDSLTHAPQSMIL